MNRNFYDMESISIAGEKVSMSQYKGKVILIVNTASKCGFTPQYKGLEALYRAYKEDGLVVLGFPCNQFARQEPDDEKTIASTCLVNYGVSFPMHQKVKVNGPQAHPVFVFLKEKLKGTFGDVIKWNFTKFLLDRYGNPVKRYAPSTRPEAIEGDIKRLL